MVGILLGGVSGLAVLLSGPAAGWISGAPHNLAKLEKRLDGLSAVARNLQKASRDVEKMGEDGAAPAMAVKGPALSTFLFSGTRSLLASVLTVVVLLFFLLVSGNSFLRRIVEILPTLQDKKQAVEIINEIQHTIAVYLGTVTAMNLLLGVLTELACWLQGRRRADSVWPEVCLRCFGNMVRAALALHLGGRQRAAEVGDPFLWR